MNSDILEGNWKQFKGHMREQWGKLTDDDLEVAAGRRDHLAGRLQEHYGLGKDAAESQIAEFEARFRTSTTSGPVCPRCGTAHAAGAPCPTV